MTYFNMGKDHVIAGRIRFSYTTIKNLFMKINRQMIMLFLALSAGTAYNCLWSQGTVQKPIRQSAMEAFSARDYETAYKDFNELLREFSKDPLYKYYCGASLVELGRNPGEALALMDQSIRNSTAVRSLPSDAWFYLGRAQQMNGKYQDAIKSFNTYIDEAGKKISDKKGVREFLLEAKAGRGEVKETISADTLPSKAAAVINPVPKIKTEVTKEVKEAVNLPVPEDPKPPVNSEKLVDQAMEFQYMADSLSSHVALQKKEIEKAADPEKIELANKILENEKLATSYQESANLKFAESKGTSILIKQPEKSNSIEAMKADSIGEKPDLKSEKVTPIMVKPDSTRSVAVIKTDSAKAVSAIKKSSEILKDTIENKKLTSIPVPAPEPVRSEVKKNQKDNSASIASEGRKQVEIYSLFKIMPAKGVVKVISPKATPEPEMAFHFQGKEWWDPQAKIEIDPKSPSGLIYRIQIAVFRNPVAPSFFKGLAPVYGFRIDGTDKTVYYAGLFRKMSDAVKALAEIRSKGFNDAFVVALSDNKKITPDKAAVLEKEWGKSPLISVTGAARNNENTLDTIPPSLSFRVEVMRSQKPVKEDVMEGMKKISAARGVDIHIQDDKSIAYLIGRFITFESASEYCDLLTRNGYREANVVAFLGIKPIPLETAKQFFEKLK